MRFGYRLSEKWSVSALNVRLFDSGATHELLTEQTHIWPSYSFNSVRFIRHNETNRIKIKNQLKSTYRDKTYNHHRYTKRSMLFEFLTPTFSHLKLLWHSFAFFYFGNKRLLRNNSRLTLTIVSSVFLCKSGNYVAEVSRSSVFTRPFELAYHHVSPSFSQTDFPSSTDSQTLLKCMIHFNFTIR